MRGGFRIRLHLLTLSGCKRSFERRLLSREFRFPNTYLTDPVFEVIGVKLLFPLHLWAMLAGIQLPTFFIPGKDWSGFFSLDALVAVTLLDCSGINPSCGFEGIIQAVLEPLLPGATEGGAPEVLLVVQLSEDEVV